MIPTVFGGKYRVEEPITNIEKGNYIITLCHDINTWKQHSLLLIIIPLSESNRISYSNIKICENTIIIKEGTERLHIDGDSVLRWFVYDNEIENSNGTIQELF